MESGSTILHWDGAEWIHATESMAALHSVILDAPGSGWAVGSGGTILRWTGARWLTVSGVTAGPEHLRAVSLASAADGWAVGQGGILWRWDGYAWSPALGIDADLDAVLMTSPSEGWVVGGIWDSWSAIYWKLALHWNGRQWVKVGGSDSGDGRWHDVAQGSSTDVWFVGVNGSYGHPIARWNGTSWQTFDPTTDDLYATAFLSSNDGWAVGEAGTIVHWNGSGWSTVASGTTQLLTALAFLSPVNGWAVGAAGTILHWNGSTWTAVPSQTSEYLRGIAMISPADGWIVGDGGTLLHWNGTTWQQVWSPVVVDLSAIDLLGAGDGWAVGNGNAFVRWDGHTWARQPVALSTNLRRIDFVSPTEGWGVGPGSAIWQWDGRAWLPLTSRTFRSGRYGMLDDVPEFNDVDAVSSTSVWIAGQVREAPIPGALQYAAAVWRWDGRELTLTTEPPGYGQGGDYRPPSISMLSDTDGHFYDGVAGDMQHWDGQAWAVSPSLPDPICEVASLHTVSATDGWAVGPQRLEYCAPMPAPIRIAHWDGSAWGWAVSPLIYGELQSVRMLSATEGWAVGGMPDYAPGPTYSIVLHRQGTTWAEVASPVTQTLRSVDVVSATDAWTVGDAGTILHWDGGSWSTVNSPTTAGLQHIRMVSATDGWAVGSGQVLHYSPIQPFTWHLEAELGTRRGSMAVGQSSAASACGYVSDPVAYSGSEVAFTVEVPVAGSYTLWARAMGMA